MSRMLLRHSGSGLWLRAEVHPFNGDIRGAFERCAKTVASICDRADIPRERAIVRCDGAHGHVLYFDACDKAGVAIITRLSHCGLFEREDIAHHLAGTTWTPVADSTGGQLAAPRWLAFPLFSTWRTGASFQSSIFLFRTASAFQNPYRTPA